MHQSMVNVKFSHFYCNLQLIGYIEDKAISSRVTSKYNSFLFDFEVLSYTK